MKIEGYLYDDRSTDPYHYWLKRVLWKSPTHFLAEFEDIEDPILFERVFDTTEYHQILNTGYDSYLFHQTN